MAVLFQNITDFKKYVSGSVDSDEGFLYAIESDIVNALNLHLAPWLGFDLVDHILDVYPDVVVNTPGYELIQKVKAALAPLSLFHASKTKSVNFGTDGLTKSESAAFKYQAADYRDEMLVSGYENIELLLRFLEKNSVNFAQWTEKERHLSHIVRYAADFRNASSYRISRLTFETLLPIIDEEEYQILKQIPISASNRLFIGTQTLETYEKTAIRLLKNVIASYVIEEALRRRLVSIENGMLVHVEAFGDQASTRQTIPNLAYTEKAHSWESVAASRMWLRFREFVYKNKSDFDYFFHTSAEGTNNNSDAWGYTVPVTEADIEKKALEAERIKNKKVIGF